MARTCTKCSVAILRTDLIVTFGDGTRQQQWKRERWRCSVGIEKDDFRFDTQTAAMTLVSHRVQRSGSIFLRELRTGHTMDHPTRVVAQGQRVRRVPTARQRRRRHLHRHPRERRRPASPRATPGTVLKGVTSCTDRVLTEGCVRLAVCGPRRAEGEPWTCAWMRCRRGRGAAPRTRCVWHPDPAMTDDAAPWDAWTCQTGQQGK